MKNFDVGDLVRDKLNLGNESYGLGVILSEPRPEANTLEDELVGVCVYDVYFTKFERTITFHGDYLEKV
jgi:hypothetical protein